MRIFKKTLKIVTVFIVSIILLMIITVAVAKIFEDKLVSFTVEKLENRIDAPISVGKVSLIPLFSFPRLSAEIHKLYIGDPQSRYSDTLFFINSLKVGLDTWDLINGAYTIDEMEISGLDLDYEVDSTGKSNIDFIIDAFVSTNSVSISDTTSTPLDLSADKLKLENIRIKYYDSLNNIGSLVTIPEITLKAKTKNNLYRGKTKGSIVLSNCLLKDTKINQMESCTITFNFNLEDKEAIIKDLSIVSEGLNLDIEGKFSYADTLCLNSTIKARGLDFNILKKYIPDNYYNFIGDQKLAQMEFLNLDLNIDYINNDLLIKNVLIKSDGLDLGINGNLFFGDTSTIDAKCELLMIDLSILKKYVPAKYFNEYGVTDIGGIMDFSAIINGKYADSTLLPKIDVDANFRKVSIKTIDYPQINALNLTASITNGDKPDMSMASVIVTNAEIHTPNSYIQLDGKVEGIKNSRYNISSNLDLNLLDFKNLIPDSIAQNLKGNVIASIKSSGVLPGKIKDSTIDYVLDNTTLTLNFNEIEAMLVDTFSIENFSADINYNPQDSGNKEIIVSKLNLNSKMLNLNIHNTSLSAIISGNVSNLNRMSARLQSFHVQNGNSIISGNADIENFGAPEFNLNTDISLSLEELEGFLPDSIINNMSGTFNAGIQSKGKLNYDSLDTQLLPIVFENSSFDLSLDNISVAFIDTTLNVDSISAQVSLKNDVLIIDSFSATYNGLEFGMDSSVLKNIYSAVVQNQPVELYVNTNIHIGDIFYDDFSYLMALGTTKAEADTINKISKTSIDTTNAKGVRNWTFLIHGFASINSIIIDSTSLDGFDINRLHINDLSTLFKLTDSAYIFDQFKFKVFEGEMNNSLYYKIRNDGTQSVSTHNIIQNMNVRTMLRDMDNFGMDSIISWENISGLFSTDLNTFVPIDDSVLINRILVSGDIILDKGGVYNYAPASEISRYTNIKELDNIQFKTLHSNVFMLKNKLYVPRTSIVTNAMDIAAFGMHSLGGDSEYHLELHLSNILFGKSKRRNNKQDISGEEIDQKSLKKRSQKIRYSVIDGKSRTIPDTKDSRDDMMNKIRVQSKMLDFIFFPKNIHYNTNLD